MSKCEPGPGMQGHECGRCYYCSRLSPLSLAMAAGIVFGLGTMFLGWVAGVNGWGMAMVQLMSSVYTGFGPSWMGGVWGGIWSFVDGFISALVFAWLYNLCLCCRKCGYKK